MGQKIQYKKLQRFQKKMNEENDFLLDLTCTTQTIIFNKQFLHHNIAKMAFNLF